MRARLLLLAGALAAFGASLGSGFHFDDYAIFSNPVLRSPWGWVGIWTLRQTSPLSYLTFWLNFQTGGSDPLGYHVLNLALHLSAVLLAYEWLRRLLPARGAFVAAALFAVHPIQAEAVNYVWGRPIVLAALACSASLLAWLGGRPWTAVAWFAAALMAKEECAAFPLALLLVAPGRKRLAPVGAMIGLALVASLRVIYATMVTPGASEGLKAGVSGWKYLLAQGLVVPRYLRLLLLPYGFTVDADVRVPVLWLGLAAWAGIVVVVIQLWRHAGRHSWCAWALAGLILLLPSSSVLPAADLSADRRMYLPMLAFSAAAGLLLARLRPPAIAPALVVALVCVSVARTQVWMSDARLWREAVRRAPDKVRPKIQLSRALPAARALELLAEAARLAPHDPDVAAETGKVLLEERQPEAALSEFSRALALDPRNALYVNNRGVALSELGQIEAARQDFKHALELDPGLTEARVNLEKLTGVR